MTATIEIDLPADLARFRLPAAVAGRLHALLDLQDGGRPLTADERGEAAGLVDLARRGRPSARATAASIAGSRSGARRRRSTSITSSRGRPGAGRCRATSRWPASRARCGSGPTRRPPTPRRARSWRSTTRGPRPGVSTSVGKVRWWSPSTRRDGSGHGRRPGDEPAAGRRDPVGGGRSRSPSTGLGDARPRPCPAANPRPPASARPLPPKPGLRFGWVH